MSESKHEIPSEMLAAATSAIHDRRTIIGAGMMTSCEFATLALEAVVPALLAELADYRDAWLRVLQEPCAPDEKHCTCVPALRMRMAILSDRLHAYEETAEHYCGADTPINADGIRGYIQVLLVRIAELEAELTKVREVLHEQTSYLEEELARVRKDAKRYRWLRSQHWSDAPLVVVREPRVTVKLGYDLPSLERLDEAIDEAMAKPEGGRG